MALSLDKKQEQVGLRLEKFAVPKNVIMRVKSIMDVTGSFRRAFGNGTIQEMFNRLIPIAMRFDDNGSLESYAFSDKAEACPEITEADFDNYVDNTFLPFLERKNILWNGTYYATAFKALWDDVMGTEKTGGFLGMFKKKTQKSLFPPTYVMFTTDGETFDEPETEEYIKLFADKKTYIQFIGVGEARKFAFLKGLADKYDYVGFATFPNLDNTSDEQMYEALLSEEVCTWIKQQ